MVGTACRWSPFTLVAFANALAPVGCGLSEWKHQNRSAFRAGGKMNVEISRANDGCRNRHRVGKSGAATGMRSPVLTEAKKEQKK